MFSNSTSIPVRTTAPRATAKDEFTTALNFRGELFDLFLKAEDLRMEIIIFWVFLMGHSHATPVMRDALHPGRSADNGGDPKKLI